MPTTNGDDTDEMRGAKPFDINDDAAERRRDAEPDETASDPIDEHEQPFSINENSK